MLDTATISRIHLLSDTILFHEERNCAAPFTFVSFGKHFRGERDVNWTFSPLQVTADAEKNVAQCRRLGLVCDTFGAQKLFGPRPGYIHKDEQGSPHLDTQAEYVHRGSLRMEVPLSAGASLFRYSEVSGDVASLDSGQAGAFSTGRCPFIVAAHRDRLMFAHAGRECLVDRARLDSEARRPFRFNETVVDTIMRTFRAYDGRAREVRVWVFGSVPGAQYPHPMKGQYAKPNTQLRNYVLERWNAEEAVIVKNDVLHLDLARLIEAQFWDWGVRDINLTHASSLTDSERVWLDDRVGQPRNLSMVIAN